jgi:hypothetical protein
LQFFDTHQEDAKPRLSTPIKDISTLMKNGFKTVTLYAADRNGAGIIYIINTYVFYDSPLQ